MWRRGFSIIVLTVLFASVVSPVPAGRRGVDPDPAAPPAPFAAAEQLVYEGEFSKLLLRGIKIAELRFTARRAPSTAAAVNTAAQASPNDPAQKDEAPFLFTGDIVSQGWFRKLFGINFHYRHESTVEPASFAILRTNKLDAQGKRIRTSEAIFDRTQNLIAWIERDPTNNSRPPRIVNAPLGGAAHDLISAIYYLRTQKLTPGREFDLVVSDSGAVYHVPAKVFAEPNKMKSVLGEVAVVRVDVELFGKDRPVHGDGQMSLWMTSDARCIPIRARVTSDLGTLEIKLKRIGGAPV